MSYHSGSVFSARDRDPNSLLISCAVSYRGAWWYKNCHYANLNGLYGSTVDHQVRGRGAARSWEGPGRQDKLPSRWCLRALICDVRRQRQTRRVLLRETRARFIGCGRPAHVKPPASAVEVMKGVDFWEPCPQRGGCGSRWDGGFDSVSTSPLPGGELVPLEGLRVLCALHGNEAETKKLPAPSGPGRLTTAHLSGAPE